MTIAYFKQDSKRYTYAPSLRHNFEPFLRLGLNRGFGRGRQLQHHRLLARGRSVSLTRVPSGNSRASWCMMCIKIGLPEDRGPVRACCRSRDIVKSTVISTSFSNASSVPGSTHTAISGLAGETKPREPDGRPLDFEIVADISGPRLNMHQGIVAHRRCSFAVAPRKRSDWSTARVAYLRRNLLTVRGEQPTCSDKPLRTSKRRNG